MQSDALSDTEISSSASGCCPAMGRKLFSKETAKYLYEDIPYIRALFGAFDGGIISYSTFKMFFDIACPPGASASDMMHEWLESPEIAVLAALESLTIIALSFIGNVFDEDDDNKFIAWAAWFWAYFRDGIKGMKFAYRGVRSSLQVALLLGVELQVALLPVGLGLGVLAAANRIWYRNQVTDPRKKYQKKNNLLLRKAQILGLEQNYELDEMPACGPLQRQKVYIKIDEKEGVLEYKIYDPFMELVKGKINLTKELFYNQQYYDENGHPRPLTIDDLKRDYFDTILSITSQRGHTANLNDVEQRHLISAEMGACCSMVTTQWPDADGSNIELGPFDAGYVRVICEEQGRNGLFYAQKKWCCSLLMSEVPDQDVSKIDLGDFESGYIRVVNEKRKINQLYYVDKKTNLRLKLELNDSVLTNYDTDIDRNDVPRALLARELADITRITNHIHKNTTILTPLEMDEEKLERYDSQVMNYCGAKVLSSQPSESEIEKVCALNQIVIVKVLGHYQIGYCNKKGKYEQEILADRFLNSYKFGEFIKKKEHQERINDVLFSLKSRSRITQANTLQALSLNQLATITALTNHVHKEKQYLPSLFKRMASAVLGGLSDGLYTYMGAFALAALSPPLFLLIITCSILFTVLCVVNRCYEEYEYQQSFIRSRLNVEFVLLQKELEETFAELMQISSDVAWRRNVGSNKCVDELLLNLKDNLLPKHKAKKKELESILVFSYPRSLLAGLRSGLYAYSAICSLMFVIAAFCSIALVAFPPAGLIAGVILGLVCLIGFTLHALYLKREHTKQMQIHEEEASYEQLIELINSYKKARMQEIAPQPEEERDAIYRSMSFDPTPQFRFQELFEMIRSCGSGLAKGRVIDFPLTRLMDLDENGHYQDTPWMVVLGLLASFFYGLVYLIRSFAKNWRGTNDVLTPVRDTAPKLPRRNSPSQPLLEPETSPECTPAMRPMPDPEVERQLAMLNLDATALNDVCNEPAPSLAENDVHKELARPLVEPKHHCSPILTSAPSSFPIAASNQMPSSPSFRLTNPASVFRTWLSNYRPHGATPVDPQTTSLALTRGMSSGTMSPT